MTDFADAINRRITKTPYLYPIVTRFSASLYFVFSMVVADS